MARGIAVDLLQMAKRVGPQYEAVEYEDLSGEEGSSLDSVIIDDELAASGSMVERAPITKLPSWRVCPETRASPKAMLSLMTRRAIDPVIDVTVELSMKAPMSVSKPADLR